MNNSSNRSVAAIVLALGVLGLLLGGTWFIAQPKITVIAPAGSTITATQMGADSTSISEKASSSSTTLRVGAGYYKVVVSNNSAKQLFYGSAGAFQESKFSFTATSASYTSLVARRVAYNVVPGSSSLAYLDTTARAVERIDQNGNVMGLDTKADIDSLNDGNTGNAQGLYPVSGNQAVVLSNGYLYKLVANQLTRLDTQGMPSDRNTVVVGTNPAQPSFVVAVGQIIYWYDSVDAVPKKLIQTSKRFDQLVVGGKTVVAYSTRLPDSVEDVKASYNTTYAIDPLVIDAGNKTQRDWAIGPVVDLSVSPDGTYATVLKRHTDHTSLYNVHDLSPLYDVENPDTTTPAWTDSTHFVYGKDSDIWRFDVANKTGITVGTLPGTLDPTSITYDGTGKSYYVTTYDSVSGAAIYRASSAATSQNAQLAASVAAGLSPGSTYTLDYFDISQPTLRVTTSVILNNPSLSQFRRATLQARQAALAYLKGKGIDTSKVRIVYDPANL